ncbi:hypothetical protein [Bosea sp. 124]|uniref:hypothetical protein n=1 Tax=Bosea sp. 124 TaxID=2135642 RepID=UPI000D4898A6|nr:hypothetical protein [Bosea sp. 124]PTM43032.1 hypothetical protein C8D03_4637 [Bosea sp. 124]
MSALAPFRDQDQKSSWLPDWAAKGTVVSPQALSTNLNKAVFINPTLPSGTSITLVQQPKGPEPTIRAVGHGEQLERRLFDALAAMKIKTAEVAMHLSGDWRERLFGYLDFLHDAEDWDEQDEPAKLSSFTTFLRMTTHLKPAKRPGMGLTSAGNLVATWTFDNRHLTIECLEDDELLWSVAVPEGERTETAAGRCRVQRLAQILAPYEAQRWFANA